MPSLLARNHDISSHARAAASSSNPAAEGSNGTKKRDSSLADPWHSCVVGAPGPRSRVGEVTGVQAGEANSCEGCACAPDHAEPCDGAAPHRRWHCRRRPHVISPVPFACFACKGDSRTRPQPPREGWPRCRRGGGRETPPPQVPCGSQPVHGQLPRRGDKHYCVT